ncbi:MAG TPA: hypothetical protein VMH31_05415 [Methylomirabilota bacterium]|nr:hypothetical protein [Methylomirabilota bacterium]
MRLKISVLATLATTIVLAGCSGVQDAHSGSGSGGGSSQVSVTVTPTRVSVVVSKTETFQAKVTGSTNTDVTWLVNGIEGGNSSLGTISAAGVLTAPAQVPNPATISVTAVSQADATKSSSASVQIVASNPNQQAQAIPIKLGTSGGNASDSSTQGNLISCCGGTLGSLVQRNGLFYILSNNHILARSDLASIGDSITQPGIIDANCSTVGTTTVANLSQFVNLETAGTNVDAAMAQIVAGTVDTSGSILSLGGTATGSTADAGPPHAGRGIGATIGEAVAKSGRTTGLTCSSVDAIGITATVSYQRGCNSTSTFSVTYNGQISVSFPTGGAFSGEGDSGSLIVDQNTADPVALLYAGSDTDSVGNPVADVLTALADGHGNQPTFVGSASTHRVIGCSLASGAATTEAQSAMAVSAESLARARRAQDLHAPELLANPFIQAISIGESLDHPGEAAVLLFVNSKQIPASLPSELEGVATRIVATGDPGPHGVVEESVAAKVAPVTSAFSVNALSKEELARAKTVHGSNVNALMKQPGIQGVGITSSANAPGEAALVIFAVRGVDRNPIPASIDGLRTRIRESSRFKAGYSEGGTSPTCRAEAPAPTAALQH